MGSGKLEAGAPRARVRSLPFVIAGGVLIIAGILLTVHAEHNRSALLKSGRTVPAKILSVSGNTRLRYDVSYVVAGRTYQTTIRTDNGNRAGSLQVTYDPADPSRVATTSADSIPEDIGIVLAIGGVLCLALPAAARLRRRAKPGTPA